MVSYPSVRERTLLQRTPAVSRSPFLSLLVVCLLPLASPAQQTKPLRVGIIGLDTSHVEAFTGLLNDPKAKGDLAGVRIVAAYPGGSQDIPESRDRLDKFTMTLRDKF